MISPDQGQNCIGCSFYRPGSEGDGEFRPEDCGQIQIAADSNQQNGMSVQDIQTYTRGLMVALGNTCPNKWKVLMEAVKSTCSGKDGCAFCLHQNGESLMNTLSEFYGAKTKEELKAVPSSISDTLDSCTFPAYLSNQKVANLTDAPDEESLRRYQKRALVLAAQAGCPHARELEKKLNEIAG